VTDICSVILYCLYLRYIVMILYLEMFYSYSRLDILILIHEDMNVTTNQLTSTLKLSVTFTFGVTSTTFLILKAIKTIQLYKSSIN